MADTPPPDEQAREDRRYRAYRAGLAVVAINAATACVLARTFGPHQGTLIVAGAVAVLACLSVAVAFRFPRKAAAYLGLGLALVLSRFILLFATGTIYGFRDAPTHVFGIPLSILTTHHIPLGRSYSPYPVIHVFLATAKMFTGLDLWTAQAVVAVAFAVATLGIVFSLARSLTNAPAAAAVAGALYVGLPSVVPAGQLFQPLSLTVLLFAFMALLSIRRDIHLGSTLLVLAAMVVGVSHAYSSAIILTTLLWAGILDFAINRRLRLLLVSASLFAGAVLYVAIVTHRIDYVLELFGYTDASDSTSTFIPRSDYARAPPSTLLRITTGVALVIAYLAGFAGWLLTLIQRRMRPQSAHLLLAVLGAGYVLAYLLPVLLGGRILMLAAALLVAFGAVALTARYTPVIVPLLAIPILVVAGLTGLFAVYQFTPLDDQVAVDQPYHNEPVEEALTSYLRIDLERSKFPAPIYTSHVLLHNGHILDGRAFRYDVNESGVIPLPDPSYVVYRIDSDKWGYSDLPSDADPGRYTIHFRSYPTLSQYNLLSHNDRLGQFGPYLVERVA